jgi:hypothetical protein
MEKIMRTRSLQAALALALLASSAADTATAQSRHHPMQRDPETTGSINRRSVDQYGHTPQQCIPLCPQDTNPCDPPSYKAADGRCDWDD